MSRFSLALFAALLVAGCAPTLQARRDAAGPALLALQRGAFEDARQQATLVVATDAENPYALLVRAISVYAKAARQVALNLRTTVVGAAVTRGVNQRFLESSLTQAEADLASVEADLAVAAHTPGLCLELSPASWSVDWNGDGRVTEEDGLLLQIEEDADGKPLPADDPRRRPTFRFDDGDLASARAFVSFQRAAMDLVLAYDWSPIGGLFQRDGDTPVTFPLLRPERIASARARFLEGLDHSERSRRLYLAETDDDREWVPNPRQRNHPLPLPVDDALYATWEAVVSDLRRLVRGEEGLDLAQAAALAGSEAAGPEGPVLDVGAMLTHPKALVVDLRAIKRADRSRDLVAAVSALVGPGYLRPLPRSPLPARLARMQGELDRSEDRLGRKLRYLLWLN